MLKNLHIQNYAIIDEVEIDFSNQLNIITGETGAGKSILMGALSLILGERADSSVLIDASKKCFIEGCFVIENKIEVANFLNANEFDNNKELIIRREISNNGKSRAFINDTPATLQQLKKLTSLLVDLHQQFDSLEIGDSGFQREVIDALADNKINLIQYKASYQQLKKAESELNDLTNQFNLFNKEKDYHQFLYNELIELNFKENELEEIEQELKILNNSEHIKSILQNVFFELKDNENPIVTHVKQLINQLQSLVHLHKNIDPIIERLKSSQIELTDIANEIDFINDTVLFDESRINLINDKLIVGYKLLKKHNVNSTNELIKIKNDLALKLQAILKIDEILILKEKEKEYLLNQATEIANIISKKREQHLTPTSIAINNLLQQIGMPNAKVKVTLTETALNEYGKDEIDFLFDANKSNKLEAIKKVASGGELSRLMLCIKSLVAKQIDLATLIFDEIDSGISGEAAKQVGIIMQELAQNRQIICITHQPQIAAKANKHFFVLKELEKNKIKTKINTLNIDERKIAIAKMLSGENPSTATLASASEMMAN